MGTTVTGDCRRPLAPFSGEPAGRLGLGLRAEDSGEEAKQNSTSGSGPGEAKREGKTRASRLGRPLGPVALESYRALYPEDPRDGERGSQSQPSGRGAGEPQGRHVQMWTSSVSLGRMLGPGPLPPPGWLGI